MEFKSDLQSEKLKSEGLTNLVDTKEKQLVTVQKSLSSQKDALNNLLEDRDSAESDEKIMYVKLMNEMNAKLEEMNENETRLAEREVLLSVKEQEVKSASDSMVAKENTLKENLELMETRQRELEDKETKRAEAEAEDSEALDKQTEEMMEMKVMLSKFGEVEDGKKVLDEKVR